MNKKHLLALSFVYALLFSIHDHANSHCFVKVLDGTLRETRFAWPDTEGENMKEIGQRDAIVNDVTYMSGKMTFQEFKIVFVTFFIT